MASNRKRISLIGRIGAGKTTLLQCLTDEEIKYEKTQQVTYYDHFIDTPGEFLEMSVWCSEVINVSLDSGLIIIVCSTVDQMNSIRPNFIHHFNVPVIGVVTKIDLEEGNIKRARRFLKYAGISDKNIYEVSSVTGEGIPELSAAIHEYIDLSEGKTKRAEKKEA